VGYEVLIGNCLETMEQIEDESIDTCVTSPPYWGLRDYQTASWDGGDENCDHQPPEEKGEWITSVSEYKSASHASRYNKTACHKCGALRVDSQLGMEETPEEYVEKMVDVFRVVWRKLKPSGTVWLNLGDSYAGGGGSSGHTEETKNIGRTTASYGAVATGGRVPSGLKAKDLVGIPWRVALALQADGWWLRQDIIWSKPSCMPEAVKDRCTKSHEYIFLLTKNKSYYYDHEAIKEPISGVSIKRMQYSWDCDRPSTKRDDDDPRGPGISMKAGGMEDRFVNAGGRNKRSVWTVSPKPYPGAHFAVYPPDLIEPCILAGTSAHGCCADCGSPWRRVTERRSNDQDDELEQKTEGLSNPKRGGQRVTSTGAVPSYAGSSSVTTGWQPTCECHGKLVKRDVIIPATMSKADLVESSWGASLDGQYHGEAKKDFDSVGVQNASDVKRRIIENASKDRVKKIKVYESEIPLNEHPIKKAVVLDPFGGSGTTAGVAIKHNRNAILCELNEDYAALMDDRISKVTGGFRKGQLTLSDY